LELSAVNNLLNSSQHGFVSGHSTCTNLLESLNDWSINIRNGNYTRVAYVDFAKAFDSVCHRKLLHKLSGLGISGPLHSIISSFLSNRSQCVVINGSISKSVKICSGIPQGSVLGPILFVIYINDLADSFPESVISKYFADDAKLYTEIKSGEDIDKLQLSLDKLTEWANDWQLSVSIGKCCTMDLTIGNNGGSFYDNSINFCEIPNVASLRDLGVTFDSKLCFTPHVLQIVTTAKQRLFLLFRSFVTKDSKALILGFKSYILPLLNYCSSVWSPSLVGDIGLLESVQRIFTRKLQHVANLSYFDRLKELGLPTLELRRLHADLILCYKILNGIVAGPPENFGLFLSERQSRGNSKKLLINHVRINVRKNFFGCRVSGPWNSLPDVVANASSVIVFKRLIKTCDFSHFLMYTE